MKSAILEKGEQYYTYLRKIFEAIENKQIEYNWLITDCICYPQNEGFDELFSQEYIWISGNELTKIIQQEDIQFIWGVFSAFSKDLPLEEVLKYELPFADGYEGFWVDNVSAQHPLANIEIVAWDSSLVLFISRDDMLVQKFRKRFPLSEDLSEQNIKNNSEIEHIQELLIAELTKRKIDINEEILYKKYFIWNKLYYNRKKSATDKDIILLINEILNTGGAYSF